MLGVGWFRRGFRWLQGRGYASFGLGLVVWGNAPQPLHNQSPQPTNQPTNQPTSQPTSLLARVKPRAGGSRKQKTPVPNMGHKQNVYPPNQVGPESAESVLGLQLFSCGSPVAQAILILGPKSVAALWFPSKNQLTWLCAQTTLEKTTFLLVSWPFCTSMLVGRVPLKNDTPELGTPQKKQSRWKPLKGKP